MTSIEVISLEGGERPAFAPLAIELEIRGNTTPPPTPTRQRRATVAPCNFFVGEARIPRYLRDPYRRNSIKPKPSVEIDNESLVITNGSATKVEGIEGSSTGSAINNSSDVLRTQNVGKTTVNNNTARNHYHRVDDHSGYELKPTERHDLRRKSEPFPVTIDIAAQSKRRASQVGSYKGTAGFYPSYANYGSKLKGLSISKPHRETDNEHELAIVVSSPSPTPIDNESKNVICITGKLEHVRPPSTSSDSIFKMFQREESPLPGMSHFDELEPAVYPNRERTVSYSVGSTEKIRKPSVRNVGHFIPKPDNHFVLSLFSCLCCCPLLGVVAVILSSQVDSKYEDGDKEGSIVKSQKAKCWALTAVMIGMLTIAGATMYAVVVYAIIPQRKT